MLFLLFGFYFVVSHSFGQSVTATYNAGNIATSLTNYSPTCNGPTTALTVNIPAGASVTGIDISYNFTATGGAWMSEQRSRIHCQETGNTETTVNGSGGSSGGTESYSRAGVNIANGVSATGTLTFEMQAWRSWGGSVCDQSYQYINNNSWSIRVHYFIPGVMTYTSSTVTQANTQTIQSCEGSAAILGVRLETTGSISPINFTGITVGTAGTTNLSEIGAINVYYTGASPNFATTNLYGTSAPSTLANITGNQSLQAGTNYFWIEYQLIPTLTVGNAFDAACTQINIGGTNHTPTSSSPAGNRTVIACNPSPGGIATNLQAWFDANTGTTGTPVTTWDNLGPNANITQLTSPNGGNLVSDDLKANYNNIVHTTGGYNGTFHSEVSDRTQLIAGNGVTMYAAYQVSSAPDLMFEFHGSVQTNVSSNSANQWLSWGFRHGGLGSIFSNGASYLYDNTTMAQMSQNSNYAGLFGTGNASGGNTMNGSDMNYANIGAFHSGGNFMELSIGYWPGYGMSRGVMEAILWDSELTEVERARVETYLAIKYGVTHGMNGISMDYISPFDGSVIWDVSANPGFNYDIAGIMRADISGLDQRKSHSTNGAAIGTYNDIVTIANGTNYSTPVSIANDGQALVWGHDNGALINTGIAVNYPTDNGELIQAIFTREWKSQETGSLGTVTIEFDLSAVVGVGGILGANDLQHVRLLIDEDGNYATGATSIAPIAYNNATGRISFEHDFILGTGNQMDVQRGFFFTLGTTDLITSPLPVELIYFDADNSGCETVVTWSTASEQHCDYYQVERSYDMEMWEHVAIVSGSDNSTTQLDYEIVDREFNQNGAIYYRLTQYDTDGTKTMLGAKGIQAACGENEAPVVYPNPSNSNLNVYTPSAGILTILDAQGRVVRVKELLEGENLIVVNDIAAGTYTASVQLNNGKFYREQWVKM